MLAVMSARMTLRHATVSCHDAVDAAFARYDLTDPASYGDFLAAHARVLPAVEAALTSADALPHLRPRAPALTDDLAALGRAYPVAERVRPPADDAEAFGMAYVIEGSRLGGGMLARQVGVGLPTAYLSAVHLPGEWRAFGDALDAAAGDDEAWLACAVAAAERVFALYRAAADA